MTKKINASWFRHSFKAVLVVCITTIWFSESAAAANPNPFGVPLGNTAQSAPAKSDFAYTINQGQVTITKYTGSRASTLTIPSTIEGFPVKKIGDWAFSECQLKTVIFSEGISEISNYAFQGASHLETVKLPNSIERIGACAFRTARSSVEPSFRAITPMPPEAPFRHRPNAHSFTTPAKQVGNAMKRGAVCFSLRR